jgi:hypothetical protein
MRLRALALWFLVMFAGTIGLAELGVWLTRRYGPARVLADMASAMPWYAGVVIIVVITVTIIAMLRERKP